jgi:ribosomal protein S6E (S10)
MGGNDKQGFGMKQGVLTQSRVFLLMSQKTSGFQGHGRRKGERRRKVGTHLYSYKPFYLSSETVLPIK